MGLVFGFSNRRSRRARSVVFLAKNPQWGPPRRAAAGRGAQHEALRALAGGAPRCKPSRPRPQPLPGAPEPARRRFAAGRTLCAPESRAARGPALQILEEFHRGDLLLTPAHLHGWACMPRVAAIRPRAKKWRVLRAARRAARPAALGAGFRVQDGRAAPCGRAHGLQHAKIDQSRLGRVAQGPLRAPPGPARRRRGKVAHVMSCVWGDECVVVNDDTNLLLEKCSIAGCGNAFHHVCAGKVRFCACACRHSCLRVLLRAIVVASADSGGRRGSMRAVRKKGPIITVATHRAGKAWLRLRSERDPQEAPSPLR